jgi:hypothetical protein
MMRSGILHHDLREGRAVILCHVRDLDRDTARDLFVHLGDVAVRVGRIDHEADRHRLQAGEQPAAKADTQPMEQATQPDTGPELPGDQILLAAGKSAYSLFLIQSVTL